MASEKWLKQLEYFAKNPEAHEKAKARHRAWHKARVAQGKINNKANRKKYKAYYDKYNLQYRTENKEAIKVARTLKIPLAEARKLIAESGERNAKRRASPQSGEQANHGA